jgi:hypothetical protein
MMIKKLEALPPAFFICKLIKKDVAFFLFKDIFARFMLA